MDLELELTPVRTRGRAPKHIQAELGRELTPADFALLSTEKGSKPPSLIKRLSDRHHAAARCFAAGMKPMEVTAITGLSASRVSILRSDPAFSELVEFYREHVDQAYFDMHQQLAGLSADALLELRERLEESPEDFSVGQLLSVMSAGADRTGYGVSSKQEVNVNVGIADKMEAARKRLAALRPAVDVIDLEVEP